MSLSKTENIAKLSDNQLYALTQCHVLEPDLRKSLEKAVAHRQLDLADHKTRWNAILYKPFPKLSLKDQFIIWVTAIFFPMALGLIPLIVSYFYFRNNPYRFEVYLKRSFISMLFWCLAMSIYFYYDTQKHL